jgi:uncharacterized protein (TIGR00369 family)
MSEAGGPPTVPTENRIDEVDRVFRAAPFIQQLGARLVRVSGGACESVLSLEQAHLQQDGYVHAGVQATLADHTAGAAAASLANEGQYVLTAEFKISLLRAARGDRLRCVARVLKPGSRLMFAESEVYCERGETAALVAKATVTLAVLPRPESA